MAELVHPPGQAVGITACLQRLDLDLQLRERAVAVDFITKGIRCNAICPGTIETPSMLGRAASLGAGGREMFVSRQPMGRLGTAEEIASLAVYLASDESAFTTGVAHIIDGGWTL